MSDYDKLLNNIRRTKNKVKELQNVISVNSCNFINIILALNLLDKTIINKMQSNNSLQKAFMRYLNGEISAHRITNLIIEALNPPMSRIQWDARRIRKRIKLLRETKNPKYFAIIYTELIKIDKKQQAEKVSNWYKQFVIK